MIGNPQDRDFFTIAGAVKLSGGSLNLSKGELALIDQSKSTSTGLKVLATLAGKSKREKNLSLRLGVSEREATRSHGNGSYKTLPFALNEVVDLRVSAPKHTEQQVDEIILGYDGINEDSAFSFKKGDSTFRVTLELKGDALAYRGGGNNCEYVSVNIEVPDCDPYNDCEDCNSCENVDAKPIIMEAIERLRRKQLAGGQTVDQFVDITPVFRCDDALTATEIPYDYYCLDVCDSGTDNALALIANQYDTPVIRTGRVGATSTYQMFLPQSVGAPSDYSQTLASLIKGCSTCPAGYTATVGGILYSIVLEDNGTDLSTTVDDLPGYVAGTVNREDGRSAGLGFYTIVLDNALTDAEITTFLAISVATSTAVIEEVGDIAAICENGTVTTTAWATCGSCNAIEETYNLTLPDDECGNDRLAEINGAYANHTVTIAQKAATSVAVTLTGAAGTAVISIGTESYSVTFNTDLTTTAEDFDALHSADIFANHNGMLVTSAAGVLTFTDETATFVEPTIANATGDVAGTVGATSATSVADQAACQTRYTISMISNIVCDECDDVFKDFYTTDAPAAYDNNNWVKDANEGSNPSGFCLTGIRIKGKTFVLNAEESLRDVINFVETSTLVRAAAGYPVEIREGIGRITKGLYQSKQLSKWVPRTHLGGNLRDLENESRKYFKGLDKKDYLARLLTGEVSVIEDQMVQYVMYTLEVNSGKGAQGFGQRVNQGICYHVWAEVGRHDAVEKLLNEIATSAGVPAVRAF